MARFLGLDVGGANLKISDGESRAVSVAFPLWKSPECLAKTLYDMMKEFSPPDGFALTMTGELADCFQTKAEGVDFILAAVEQAGGSLPIAVWQTGAEFVPPERGPRNSFVGRRRQLARLGDLVGTDGSDRVQPLN